MRCVFVDLFQKGVRTVYRTLGARGDSYEVDGGALHAFTFDGPGPGTIVFLHGLGDASTTWYRIVRPLREKTRFVALDLPPFGLSRLENASFLPPREQARLVARFLEDRVEGPVTLVGQSMGGWTAQWLLHDAPGLVDRAVLVSPAGARLQGSLDAIELLTPETVEDVHTYFKNLWYEPPPSLDLVVKDVLARFNESSIREFILDVGEDDLLTPEQLTKIETPGLIVWGAHDGILDPESPHYFAEHWGAPLERSYLARAGHLPHMERSEAFLSRLLDVHEHA